MARRAALRWQLHRAHRDASAGRVDLVNTLLDLRDTLPESQRHSRYALRLRRQLIQARDPHLYHAATYDDMTDLLGDQIRSMGVNDSEVFATRKQLVAYLAMHDRERAMLEYHGLMADLKRVRGEDHPATCHTELTLLELLYVRDNPKSIEWLIGLLSQWEPRTDRRSLRIGELRIRLACRMLREGEPTHAVELFWLGLDPMIDALGLDDQRVARGIRWLAWCHAVLDDPRSLRFQYPAALAAKILSCGPDEPTIAHLRERYSARLVEIGDLVGAIRQLERVSSLERRHRRRDPVNLPATIRLADLLEATGDTLGAIRLLEQAIMDTSSLAPQQWTGHAVASLGRLYLGLEG